MQSHNQINDFLFKILNPDFEISLHYPDDKITKNQRLLSNLAKLGKYCLTNNKHTPFIRVKEAESDEIIINDEFTITTTNSINPNEKVDYYIDFIYNNIDNTILYSCLYKNAPDSALFFDICYYDYPVKKTPVALFENTKSFILKKYKNQLDKHSNVSVFIHDIQLEGKKWDITLI